MSTDNALALVRHAALAVCRKGPFPRGFFVGPSENEENKRIYIDMELEDKKVIAGNDTDDYAAEG